MSELIKTVSYEADKEKAFHEKLTEHLGVHELSVTLTGGETIKGILTEVGEDYICLLVDNSDYVVPRANILFFKYAH